LFLHPPLCWKLDVWAPMFITLCEYYHIITQIKCWNAYQVHHIFYAYDKFNGW
jgi:hypothetical protein